MISFYFAFSFILIILLFLKIGWYYSKIKVIIKNIDISNGNFKYTVWISIYLFGKIKFLNLKFSEKGLIIYFISIPYERFLKKYKIEKVAEKFFERTFINKIRNFKINLEEMDFETCLGIDDVFITINLITIISTILSLIIANKTMKVKKTKIVKDKNKFLKVKKTRKYRFLIKPCFDNKLYLNGVIVLSFKTRNLGIFLNTKEHNKIKI